MHPRYSEWIKHLFDHEVNAQGDEWYWDLDAPEFIASGNDLAELFILLCKRSGQDLSSFSDNQINQGLWYLFSNSCSNFIDEIQDSDTSLECQAECILSIKTLYTDIFNVKCSPVLSHNDDPEPVNPINSSCYMFLDLGVILYWPDDHQDYFSIPIKEVLNHALRLPNIACIESALHGLGHYHILYPNEVKKNIQAFLDEKPDIPDRLFHYAKHAMIGYVQ